MRDLTDEEAKIINGRLESEAVDTTISILDNLRSSCETPLTFTEKEVYTALSMGISAIKELEKAKRLLKAAVEDMSEENFCAKVCKRDNFACRVSDTCDFKWRYADEALKLIGDELNGV